MNIRFKRIFMPTPLDPDLWKPPSFTDSWARQVPMPWLDLTGMLCR